MFSSAVLVHLKAHENGSLSRIGPRRFQKSSLVWSFGNLKLFVLRDSVNIHRINCFSEAPFRFLSQGMFYFSRYVQ